jgi:hypothetical protein
VTEQLLNKVAWLALNSGKTSSYCIQNMCKKPGAFRCKTRRRRASLRLALGALLRNAPRPGFAGRGGGGGAVQQPLPGNSIHKVPDT